MLDATTGQNGLTQARIFAEVVDVTGIVLTKLDGSAKGGIVVQVQRELGVPVKLVGLGGRGRPGALRPGGVRGCAARSRRRRDGHGGEGPRQDGTSGLGGRARHLAAGRELGEGYETAARAVLDARSRRASTFLDTRRLRRRAQEQLIGRYIGDNPDLW